MNHDLRYRPPTSHHLPKEPDLVLNFLPLTLSAEGFAGGLLPFESSDQLALLRNEHATTHIFHRQGDKIVCVPLTPHAPLLGEQTSFGVRQFAGLVRRLVHEALIRLLVGRGYLLLDLDPPSFVTRRPERDLLARSANEAAPALKWLHVYPQYTFEARVLHGRDGPRFGILVGFKTRREIDRTVAELLALGMDVRGRYVLIEETQLPVDDRRDPATRRRLAGRVDAVKQGRLILKDALQLKEVPADQAWLEARLESFATAVRLSGVANHEDILRQLDHEVFDVAGARGQERRVRQIADWLNRQGPLVLANGLSCAVNPPSPLQQGMEGGTYRRLRSPTFVFDPAGTKTAPSPDKGMKDFGPFDAEFFTPKRPRIAVVTPRAFQGDVEVFLRKFKQGIPNAETFSQGFIRKYRLSDCTFHIEAFEPGPHEAASYRQACLNTLTATPKPNLAFVIIKEEHKGLQGNDDPYLVAKSVFMSQGVPVQEVTIETIRVPPHLERSVPYALSSIALASYAKLGGIPFVISATQSLAQELVIGIGSASLRAERLTEPERVVGITTVFTADGNYLLHNVSRETPYDEYPDELLTMLRTTVDQVCARNAWQPGDTIRLVFHLFKPLKDVEAQAVKRLVEGLARDYRVEFAFLHVSEQHEWVLFDRHSEGVQDWQVADPQLRGRRKGEYVPDRGYAVLLGRSEILLATIGPRGLMTPLQGTPRPLLLKLHRESTFQDLEYLAGQLYRFTSLSWRSLFPTNRPVTILYSDLIASLLGRLQHVQHWNPDVLATTLRTSRWFL